MSSPIRFRYSVVAASCLACCFLSAHAQTQAQTQIQPPEIVVTGNTFQSKELSTPVEKISGDALVQRQAGSLGETLSGMPGLSSTYFGNAASRPIIRGLDGDRIRVLSNGASSADASGLSFDHAVADNALAAESIEIVRGPAALVYGGSAVGGVVNMLDNRIAKSALFDSKGGSIGRVQLDGATSGKERSGAALLETGTDKYALHVDGFSRKIGEINTPIGLACTQGGVTRTQNKLCNSQADAMGGALGASMLFDHGYLGASLQSTKQNYGSPAEDEVDIKMSSSRLRIEGERRNLNALSGLVQAVSGHMVQHSYIHREFDAGALGTTFQSKGLDAKLQARLIAFKVAGNAVDTAIGFSRESINFEADGQEAFVPVTQTKTRALYAVQEMSAPWGKLSAGVRQESASVDSMGLVSNPIFVAAQRSFSANSYALGGVWKLDSALRGLSATADWARTGRIPKDYELYADGEHVATSAYEVGNANLGVERSTHQELGLRFVGERKADKASFNVFTISYDNYIYLRGTGGVSAPGGNPIFQFSAAPAKFQGWELSAGKRLMSVDIEGRMSQVSAVQTLTGEALPRIPARRIGADVVSKRGAWGWRVGADYNAAQNNVPTGQTAVGGYTLWNAGLTFEQKQPSGRMLWFAKLNNAANSVAYPASSILTQTKPGRVPLPGRSLKLGVQMSF
jgi:iron complex outermembrane receptor protein